MRVLLDIHAIAGSQNGFDNSGQVSQTRFSESVGVFSWSRLRGQGTGPRQRRRRLVNDTPCLVPRHFIFSALYVRLNYGEAWTFYIIGSIRKVSGTVEPWALRVNVL